MTNFGVNHKIVVANISLGSLLFGYMVALTVLENRVGGNRVGI
jgi:hypothetical protein